MKGPKQVTPYQRWPSGDAWTVAVLAYSPDELRHRYGLEFERGFDSLDEYDLAAVADSVVGQIWLFRHVQAPYAGTEVMVDAEERTSRALDAIRRTLGIGREGIVWTNEYERNPLVDAPTTSKA